MQIMTFPIDWAMCQNAKIFVTFNSISAKFKKMELKIRIFHVQLFFRIEKFPIDWAMCQNANFQVPFNSIPAKWQKMALKIRCFQLGLFVQIKNFLPICQNIQNPDPH